MKKFCALACLFLLCLAIPGESSNCVIRQRVVVQDVQAVYAAAYAPIAVAVPQYSVGYNAGHELRELVEELKALRQEIQFLKAGQNQQQAQAPAHLKIFQNKCASCHDVAVAATKGGGFKLLENGVIADITPPDVLRILTLTWDGTMPKGGHKLTDEEYGELQSWARALTARGK